jgi:hypothetical protein
MAHSRWHTPLDLKRLLPIMAVLLAPLPARAQMASNSYVGDGTTGRKITGLGFKPDVVLLKVDFTDGTTPVNSASILRSSSMVGDLSKPIISGVQATDDSPMVANQVQSLDVDGFTVGSDTRVNKAATAIFWTAWKADADLKVGTYTGNGTTQSITGLGFSPDYLIVMATTSRRAIMACSATPVGRSFEFNSNVWFPNNITSLDAAGFSVAHNASFPYANESGVVYHYVAWNAVPLKTFVGSYNGNGTDNRNITGVGLQPEYLIVKPIYNNDAALGPTFTPPASQRYYAMVGDSMYNFTAGPATNHIQNFQTDGFQIGNATSINRQFADCDEDGGVGCAYFYVAFNNVAPDAAPLLTQQSGSNFIVSAPGSFEMTFDTTFGGGIQSFYDLAEDPNKGQDLAGGPPSVAGVAVKTLFHIGILSGGTWYTPGDNTGMVGDTYGRWNGSAPRLHVLEVTPTRVRVRQDAYYSKLCDTQPGCTAGTLAGIKGTGDYSVYSSGKVALRWTQTILSPVAFTDRDVALGVYSECPPASACANLTAYSSSGQIAAGGANPKFDTFVLAKRELPTRRTDFLRIINQDWAPSDKTGYDQNVAFTDWRDFSPVTSPLPVGTETWNFLDYFKPTNLGSTASPWLDPAVTGRATDYRSPDTLTVSVGSGWTDPSENTSGGDLFNESEAAYTLNLNPGTGLTFTIHGSTATRYHPFFKIRNWRSMGSSPSVTVTPPGAALVKDVDYRADLKPLSQAHYANIEAWSSTLENAAAVTTPDIGAAGTASGSIAFVAARYGQGARIVANGDTITFPSAEVDPTAGAIEFWFQPTYAHTDGNTHVFWQNVGDAQHTFDLQKDGSNRLIFNSKNGPGGPNSASVLIAPTDYSWRPGDWVHIRAAWDSTAGVGLTLRLFFNGVEPPHTTSNDYASAGMIVGTNYLGTFSSGTAFASGIIDEFRMYQGIAMPTLAAFGGLASSPSEYLGTGSRNLSLWTSGIDAQRRGQYLYLGSDSKFRGVNVALATKGVFSGPGDLEWEYWNGTAWASLEAVAGFTDETASFTRVGSVFWNADPAGWSLYSVNGGADLYYIRVRVAAGGFYTTQPVEAAIMTDILLFQYSGDLAADVTFAMTPPLPTAVGLSSFDASGADGAVLLSWQTATELDNLGFHLYRSSSADGPWERITSSLIPGLGSSPTGTTYSFRDRGVTNGQTYYYELEDVETTGRTERHGPVSATPNAPSPGTGAPPGPAETGYGEPASVVLREVERDGTHVVLELRTGGFWASAAEEGRVRLRIPGFESVSRPGEPSLPVRRALVEAVAGRRVRLSSFSASDELRFPGLRPMPEGAPEVESSDGGVVTAAERIVREGRAFWGAFPPEPARLAGSSFQEETKRAEVLLFPLRWDGSALVLSRRLLVRLEFEGRDVRESSRGGSRGRRRPEGRSDATTGVVARVVVKEKGLQRVAYEDVFGPVAGRGRRGVPESELRLSRQGKSVAFHVEPRTSVFAPGSTLYFLGEEASPNAYGDAVYELETRPAQDGLRMAVEGVASTSGKTTEYLASVDREENHYYQAGLLDAPDLWLWDVLVSPGSKSLPFTVSDLAPSSSTGRLTVEMQGASDFDGVLDHHVKVMVNGMLLGEKTWDGKVAATLELELSPGILREGTNSLDIEDVGDTGALYSMVFLNRFSVRYPRRLVASEGKLEGRFDSTGRVEVEGLASSSFVIDTTDVPKWLIGATPTGNGLSLSVEGGRSYLLASTPAHPEVKHALPSGLLSPTNRADYLLLAPREFLAAAQPLLELRQGQGLVTMAVSVEEVYDAFGHGEASPEAIKAFLEYAYHSWAAPSPRYVLLLGDASYDPNDYLGTGVRNWIPGFPVRTTYLWTVSDPAYASVNGDDLLPDIAIGRLPAASPDEASRLVRKVIAYENGGGTLDGSAVLVADNTDQGGNFEADAEEVAATVLAARSPRKIYYSVEGAGTRGKIRDAFDGGASLMSYVGHGGTVVWASENFFNWQDAAALQAQPQQPLLLTMNCLNGFFHFPPLDSLSEALLKAEGKGVVAAISPSGLSVNEPAHVLHKALLQEIVSGRHERIGDAVLAAQETYSQSGALPELLSIYNLLGDPALRIR